MCSYIKQHERLRLRMPYMGSSRSEGLVCIYLVWRDVPEGIQESLVDQGCRCGQDIGGGCDKAPRLYGRQRVTRWDVLEVHALVVPLSLPARQ